MILFLFKDVVLMIFEVEFYKIVVEIDGVVYDWWFEMFMMLFLCMWDDVGLVLEIVCLYYWEVGVDVWLLVLRNVGVNMVGCWWLLFVLFCGVEGSSWWRYNVGCFDCFKRWSCLFFIEIGIDNLGFRFVRKVFGGVCLIFFVLYLWCSGWRCGWCKWIFVCLLDGCVWLDVFWVDIFCVWCLFFYCWCFLLLCWWGMFYCYVW